VLLGNRPCALYAFNRQPVLWLKYRYGWLVGCDITDVCVFIERSLVACR